MPLSPGTRLGHYDVTALIGEGGMGQVWQATDTQLNRQVALKILPDAFAADPDRLARFKREAQILASLNHPNIAAIYGIEESESTSALVLELVEGPTLADRISKGPIPLGEALPIAKQIAEALEAAHEAGVIHRDLKPANIKVREDGTVKVLDFGLAKALDPDPEGDPSQSPTLTAAATQMGVIIGTAAYMSPEQASGEPADRRSDTWSFGVVLFEMLTGQRLFTGKTVSHVLAKVLDREIDLTMFPAATPAPMRRLLRRCLGRDRKRRLLDVGEALSHLEETATAPADEPVGSAVVAKPAGWRRSLPFVATGAAVALLTGLVVWNLKPPLPQPVTRIPISVPPSAPITLSPLNNDVAISPDGARLVYQTVESGTPQLRVRLIDQIEATPLRGPIAAVHPFMSPEGAWVGFMAGFGGDLQKVSTFGGPPVTICELPANLQGASWGADDTIIFGTASGSGLLRVSAAGGEPEAITTPDTIRHTWPDILPNGAGVLFTLDSGPGAEDNQIALLDLDTGEHEVIIASGTHPRYAATGHIVYGVAGTLRAVAFDLGSREVTSDPVPVVEGVAIKASGAASFDLSETGSLVYVSGAAATGVTRTLVWVDRDGREEPIALAPAAYGWARVSPDGTRLVFSIAEPDNTDVWVSDLTRPGTRSKVTTDPGADAFPVWTPDGEQVVFQSLRDGQPGLFQKAADGTGQVEPLLTVEGATFLFPTSGRLMDGCCSWRMRRQRQARTLASSQWRGSGPGAAAEHGSG